MPAATELALPAQPSPLPAAAKGVAALDPAKLTRTAEAAARALMRQGEAKNTQASYRSALRYWCAWYALRYGAALTLPLPVPVMIQFIVDHAARQPEDTATPSAAASATTSTETADDVTAELDADARQAPAADPLACADLVTELPPAVDEALVRQGYKARLGAPALNTLLHRVSVMTKAHELLRAGEPLDASTSAAAAKAPPANPCADALVRELLARTRRAYAQRGERARRQNALTKEPLQRLLATCDESVQGTRDRALLLFAFSTGGRRRSEVASARLQDLRLAAGGAYVFTLGHSKTNQAAQLRPEDAKPLVGSAALAMRKWLAVLAAQGVREGALFRRVRRGGHIGEALQPAAVRDIVRARCALAGLEGEFSAHSLRSGFVTEAGKQNVPLAETMALTGHHSVATVMGYFRAEGALSAPAANLVDR
ncbi:site-specific integrase [Variovorax soli]|uniref:site-specific integrase n=1 Tax=Variovorax soli TaxID=376815 RepID=UPI000B031563|nr:site-specific integrase [Variovorax soli]